MNKFLIYKVSGGLNHMLIQINNAIEISKITNRKLIIDCYSGAFCNDFNKYFGIKNFEYYTDYDILKKEKIEGIENIIKSSIKYSNGDYFLNQEKLPSRRDDFLNSEEKLVVMTTIKENFKNIDKIFVRKNILDEIKEKKEIKNYIGIHYRNTDMKHNIEDFVKQLGQIKDIFNIYLSTDDFTAKEKLEFLTFGEYNIIQYTKPIDNQGKNIHYGNPNKDEVIINSLIDIYYLVKSDIFLSSPKSSFSKKVIELRKKDTFFNSVTDENL